MSLLSLIFIYSSPAMASPPLLHCSFHHKEKPGIQYTTTMEIHGSVVSKGTIGKEPFECSYEIKNFNYSPGAMIPEILLELKRKTCKTGSTVAQRTRSFTTLNIQKIGNHFECRQDLMLHFKTDTDPSPKLDAKQIKFYQEKYVKRVWP